MTATLAAVIADHLDEMHSGPDGSRQEQRVDGLRAQLDTLLDTGADLTAFAAELGLDTGELPPNPATHIGLLTVDRRTALATARELAFGAVSDVRTGRVTGQ